MVTIGGLIWAGNHSHHDDHPYKDKLTTEDDGKDESETGRSEKGWQKMAKEW